MNKLVLTLLIVASALASTAQARTHRWHHRSHRVERAHSLSSCEAIRIVEMREALISANLYTRQQCPDAISDSDVNEFTTANLPRMNQAIHMAVSAYIRSGGSHTDYDHFEMRQMSSVNAKATSNPQQFCSEMAELTTAMRSLTIDELVQSQTGLPLLGCEFE